MKIRRINVRVDALTWSMICQLTKKMSHTINTRHTMSDTIRAAIVSMYEQEASHVDSRK
jgi:hypothetical protein